MEKFFIAINSAVQQGDWGPIQNSSNKPQLSHLFFADDVILFTKPKNSQSRFIIDLSDHFSRALRLKINLFKSRAFFSSGTPQAKINRLTSIYGIRSTTSLQNYIGFRILKGRAKEAISILLLKKCKLV